MLLCSLQGDAVLLLLVDRRFKRNRCSCVAFSAWILNIFGVFHAARRPLQVSEAAAPVPAEGPIGGDPLPSSP